MLVSTMLVGEWSSSVHECPLSSDMATQMLIQLCCACQSWLVRLRYHGGTSPCVQIKVDPTQLKLSKYGLSDLSLDSAALALQTACDRTVFGCADVREISASIDSLTLCVSPLRGSSPAEFGTPAVLIEFSSIVVVLMPYGV